RVTLQTEREGERGGGGGGTEREGERGGGEAKTNRGPVEDFLKGKGKKTEGGGIGGGKVGGGGGGGGGGSSPGPPGPHACWDKSLGVRVRSGEPLWPWRWG